MKQVTDYARVQIYIKIKYRKLSSNGETQHTEVLRGHSSIVLHLNLSLHWYEGSEITS
jgi:hypothetical protein